MTAEPYVLASSDAVIVLAQDLGLGTSHVTAWTRGEEEKVARAGALVCAQHAAGQWSRVDRRPPFPEVGIAPAWTEAWKLCEELVPELIELGLRTRGDYLVLGDPRQRLEAARARVNRAKARKRAGQKEESVEDAAKDQGATGLGGMRWS